MRLGLTGVNDIGELQSILDEKDGNVVSNNIPITLLCVVLDSEPADIADGVCGATATKHSGESNEYGCLAGRIREDLGGCDVCSRLKEGELSEGTDTSCMDNTFGNTLVIEALDL